MNKHQLNQIYSSIKRDRENGSNIPKMMKLGKYKKRKTNAND